MHRQDVEYVTLHVPEWHGSVRLGSVDADTAVRILTSKDAAYALFVRSLIDGPAGRRVPKRSVRPLVRRFKKKNTAVMDRLVTAALRLNDANTPANRVQRRLRQNPSLCIAHRIARERGKTNVASMLRSMTSRQFRELAAFVEMEPYPEPARLESVRLDERFALLASVVAGSAGATGPDGKPYTTDTFLRQLRGEPVVPVKQTVEQMEARVHAWMNASNKIIQEQRGY